MPDPATNYHREFLRSPHHGWLALLSLGVGFLSAELLGLILGTTAYVLGWIYLPDMPFFRRWVRRRREAQTEAATQLQVAEFSRRRQALLVALAPERIARYQALSAVCSGIESATASGSETSAAPVASDPRLRKLDELMWTYLRLLTIEQSLEGLLETERSEDVPRLTQEAEAEVARLTAEVDKLKPEGGTDLELKQRLLGSRLERLQVLRKRLERSAQAQANLSLVVSEQERLDQQIRLIRADAIAVKNTEALTARIDATVEHLDQTNKWLAEMDDFQDLVGDLPPGEGRVGFEVRAPRAESQAVSSPPKLRPRPQAKERG